MIVSLPVIQEFHPISVINNNVPEFATLKYLNYTVYPKSKIHIGDFLVQGIIFNKYTFRTFKFRIRVINNPPRFVSQLQTKIDINNIDKKIIYLPEVIDDESNPWTINAHETGKRSLPSFIKFHNNSLLISPTISSVGIYFIRVDITDAFDASSQS